MPCDDLCPDAFNVMSAHQFPLGRALLSPCQLREMVFELFSVKASESDVEYGSRNQVVIESLTPPDIEPRFEPGDLAPFKRGDTNGNRDVDISDALRALLYLFRGQSIRCTDVADTNDDVVVNLTDVTRLLGHLFQGATAYPAPGVQYCSGDGVAVFQTDGLTGCTYDAGVCPP